jgi:hypothetical protein
MQSRLYLEILSQYPTYFPMKGPKRVTEGQLTALYETRTDEQIGKMFGVSGRQIGDWRRHHGIPRKPRETYNKYTLDRDFFAAVDTEEKAYALGLLASDGWVTRSGKQVCLALQVRDRHILYDLRRVMKSNARVFDKTRGGFPGSGPRKQIIFDSKKLVTDLAKWGVIPGKSVTLRYPRIPKHLERHFARGLFDGDGHIRALPKKAFYFLGTSDLIDGLRKSIIRHTGIALAKSDAKGCWRISGYGGSVEVLRWMYKDATISLRRKRRVFLEYWQ